ncbi:MAG TPA: hypothetical protein VMD49_06435 [Steroidobacteraceae bacterium]|nr:hypothetical protein [Steroidobacteraceae bacterium]
MILVQSLIAGLLVLASALYATWRLMTPRTRIWVIERLAAIAPGMTGRWLTRLRGATSSGAAGGCESCSAGAAKRHIAR